jgi:hypothetical protein
MGIPQAFFRVHGWLCRVIVINKKQNAPFEKGNIRKIHENHPRRDVLPVVMRNGDSAGNEIMRGVANEGD